MFQTIIISVIILLVFIFLFLSLLSKFRGNTEEETTKKKPEYDSVVVGNEVIRKIWTLSLWPAVSGVLAFIFTGNILWIGLVSLTGIMLYKGFVDIESDPPHFGIMTFYKRKYNIVFGEGLKVLLNFFPFYIGHISLGTAEENKDFVFKDIRCRLKEDGGVTSDEKGKKDEKKDSSLKAAKSGGEVTVDASVTYRSDKKRPMQYINIQKEKGVEKQISDMLANHLRQLGEGETWEQVTFSKDRLLAKLITLLTGKKVWNIDSLKKGTDGEPVFKDDVPIFRDSIEIKDRYIDLNEVEPPLGESVMKSITFFLKTILRGGIELSDEHFLGILISRVYVTRAEPQGELKKAAEEAANEVQQARRIEIEQDIRNKFAAKAVQEARAAGDKKFSFQDALDNLQIEDGKAKKQVVKSSGNPLLDAAALLNQGKGG